MAGPRAAALQVLEEAHAHTGNVSGRGRGLDISKPLAHAYVIGVVSEFQGFTRDLHDLMVQRLVSASGADPGLVPILTEGLTAGRGIDRGNADLRTIKADFARVGMTPLDLSTYNPRWGAGDSAEFPHVFRLRNVLAHGNERRLRALRGEGVQDTVTWARRRLPVLNRVGKSLDHLVWDYLQRIIGGNPWR